MCGFECCEHLLFRNETTLSSKSVYLMHSAAMVVRDSCTHTQRL